MVDNSSGTDIAVSWAEVSGVTAYSLYLSTSSGGPWGSPAITTASTINNVVPALTPDTTYYLTVSALNGSIESAKSPQTVVHVVGQPPAPGVIAASNSSFNVTWAAVSGASTYDLERSDDNSKFTVIAAGLATTSYLDTSVVSTSSYSYRYRPIRASGTPMATSNASGLATSGVAPLPPVDFGALANSATSVQLDWVQVPTATQYRLYRGTNSGGPYVALATVPSSNTTYTDSTASAGQTYFYVATSLNTAGAESAYSNESAVATSAGPATLNASIVGNSVALSWSSVAGATSYIIRRSETSGGPYGPVGTGIASTTYQDTSIEHGRIYYYVADAVFASGAVSVHSPEAMATGSNTMNLEVPVELTDQALGSSTSTITFERTRTSLNTADYDGTVGYFLEAVVANYSASPAGLSILDEADTVVGTMNVPGMTNSPTRMRVSFAPSPGAHNYRLRIAATAATGTLQVLTAKMVIVQLGASRTKIYYPLLSSGALPNESDLLAAVQATNATDYSTIPSATPYRREVANLGNIVDYNAWTLESLVAAGPGTEGSVALYNTTTSSVVEGSEAIFSNNSITLIQSSLDEGTSGFGSANDYQNFEIAMKCTQGCTSDLVNIYKAGLWVSLQNLNKAQIIYRTSLGLQMVTNPTVNEYGRTLVNLTSYSNPVISGQAVGAITMGSGPITAKFSTTGANDSGQGSLTPISGSDMTFSVTPKSVSTTPALSIPSGSRVLLEVDPQGSTFNLNSSALIIKSSR